LAADTISKASSNDPLPGGFLCHQKILHGLRYGTYDRNRNRIAELPVTLDIGNLIDFEFIRKTLDPGTLPRRQLAGIFSEPRLIDKDLATIFVVSGADRVAIRTLRGEQAVTEAVALLAVFF
jgi:hypothetical protein